MGRCTAKAKRTGKQCRCQAVRGYSVCTKHGAGTRRNPGGRPRIHGAYARAIGEEELLTWEELQARDVTLSEELALARLQLVRASQWVTQGDAVLAVKVPANRVEAERARLEGTEGLEVVPLTRCDGKLCPAEVLDRRLDMVARVAEKAKRVADGITVRIVDEAQVAKVTEVIIRHVPDPATREAIAAELEALVR